MQRLTYSLAIIFLDAFFPATGFSGLTCFESLSNVESKKVRPWPEGIILYKYDKSLNTFEVSKVDKIMSDLMVHVELKWIKMDEIPLSMSYLLITSTEKNCFADVGYTPGVAEHKINIGKTSNGNDTCFKNYVITHLLLHVAGFGHEHQRSDRDDHMEILWENIDPIYWKNFYKDGDENFTGSICTKELGVSQFGNCFSGYVNYIRKTSYNFNSIMHYSPLTHSKNGKAVFRPRRGTIMGQNNILTSYDLENIHGLYPSQDIPKKGSPKRCSILKRWCKIAIIQLICKKSCEQKATII